MDTHVVIMAGGIGSRLWPVSTPEKPKQFIDVLGIGKTLIQMTVERFLPVCNIGNFWVVTSEAYVDMVKEQLPLIPADHILAEPVARNTAPCIAYASTIRQGGYVHMDSIESAPTTSSTPSSAQTPTIGSLALSSDLLNRCRRTFRRHNT